MNMRGLSPSVSVSRPVVHPSYRCRMMTPAQCSDFTSSTRWTHTDNNASKYLTELDMWFCGFTHKQRWTIVNNEIRHNNGNIWQDLDGFWCFYPFVDTCNSLEFGIYLMSNACIWKMKNDNSDTMLQWTCDIRSNQV